MFTNEELIDIEYAIQNALTDIKDYQKDEDTAEQVAKLEALQAKVQGIQRQPKPEQPTAPPSEAWFWIKLLFIMMAAFAIGATAISAVASAAYITAALWIMWIAQPGNGLWGMITFAAIAAYLVYKGSNQ